MSKPDLLTIKSVSPGTGIEGGKVFIECPGYEPFMFHETVVKFNGISARMSMVSREFVSSTIPSEATSGPVVLEVGRSSSNKVHFEVAKRLATNLHPVSNPAVDREGNIYVTLSGMRGQKLPISIYKVIGEGSIVPFASNIMNPSGMAINRDGELFVSNRNDGTVHRVSSVGNHTIFAEGLGVCTGLVFDREENLYVGDREGTVYKLEHGGRKVAFAKLTPSVAAYHMAFGPDGCLYVTGPTLSGYDCVYKINSSGNVQTFFSELGRPQGFAFDSEGNLHLVCYFKGKGGIAKVSPQREVIHEVAGVNLVGLAFDGHGNMVIVSTSSVYKLRLGIAGLPIW